MGIGNEINHAASDFSTPGGRRAAADAIANEAEARVYSDPLNAKNWLSGTIQAALYHAHDGGRGITDRKDVVETAA